MKFTKHLLGIAALLIITSLPLKSQKKVACVGNSITYGYGLNSRESECYPTQMGHLLGSEWEVSNFGINARTMLKKGNLPYWNEPVYRDAKNLNPDLVIIKLGTNDSKLDINWKTYKDEFETDYRAMIQSFRELPSKPEIWICLLVPAYHKMWDISDSIIKNGVNPKILKIAKEEGIGLIDCYSALSGNSSWFHQDGIHPNAEGAKVLARTIYNAISTPKPEIILKNGKTLLAPEAEEYQWYKNGTKIKSKSGQKRKLKAKEPGQYHVQLKLSDNTETLNTSKTYMIKE